MCCTLLLGGSAVVDRVVVGRLAVVGRAVVVSCLEERKRGTREEMTECVGVECLSFRGEPFCIFP
jgi:hypothetical protein